MTAQRQAAEHLAARFPALLVQAQRVAATVAQGIHGRRRVGQGEAFWQFRPRDESDPSTAIDWRRSARSDSLFVREREWEAAQTVWIWVANGPSMAYRSQGAATSKLERAELLGLALASLLLRAGERVVPLVPGGRAVRRMEALERLIVAWEEARERVLPDWPLPRYGRVVLIGDFLEPPETLSKAIDLQAERHVSGHVVQIADPAEEDMPFSGRTRFEGMGNALNLLVGRAETLRKPYRARYQAHRAAIRDHVTRVGWRFTAHRTDTAVQVPLLALYQGLADQRVLGPQAAGGAA